MKKLLIAILFFGSVGMAMAQAIGSPEYYRAMMSGWNPNSPVVRAVTPTMFQAPVQARAGDIQHVSGRDEYMSVPAAARCMSE